MLITNNDTTDDAHMINHTSITITNVMMIILKIVNFPTSRIVSIFLIGIVDSSIIKIHIRGRRIVINIIIVVTMIVIICRASPPAGP